MWIVHLESIYNLYILNFIFLIRVVICLFFIHIQVARETLASILMLMQMFPSTILMLMGVPRIYRK